MPEDVTFFGTAMRERALGKVQIRIGVHTGPIVAGIVGVKKFAYEIRGHEVNIASRVESSGEVGQVNISESTYALIREQAGRLFDFTARQSAGERERGDGDALRQLN
ncbi:MAG: adenylate/guanylate cyclase domain-containing protein [Flavobacteriales bacterium]